MTPAEFKKAQLAIVIETIVAFFVGVTSGLTLIALVFWAAL